MLADKYDQKPDNLWGDVFKRSTLRHSICNSESENSTTPSEVAEQAQLLRSIESRIRKLQKALLDWFQTQQRPLPWREHEGLSPEVRVYRTWISEIMLQQTQVSTVINYFNRWQERFPTVQSLAEAEETEVLKHWQGLGYYRRARQLHAAAQLLFCDGTVQIPQQVKDWRALPGIGDYTAGAIASIAQEQRVPLVDGNVIRVLTRLFALGGDPNKAPLKKLLWDIAERLVPASAPGDFNQSLMELGSEICTPRQPRCHECPASKHCQAIQLEKKYGDSVMRYPELKKAPPPTQLAAKIAIISSPKGILLRKNPTDSRHWAGLYQLPSIPSNENFIDQAGFEHLVFPAAENTLAQAQVTSIRYAITRFRFTASIEKYHFSKTPKIKAPLFWAKAEELADFPLPAPHKKLLDKLFSS